MRRAEFFGVMWLALLMADLVLVHNAQAQPAPSTNAKAQEKLEKAAVTAYKGLYYNNDFKYVVDPAYEGWHLGEDLKRQTVGTMTTVDVGGEYRARYHSEHNLRAKPLTGADDDFLLHRTRLYMNAEIGSSFRFFGEAIDATSNAQNLTPRTIEVNRFDALNLFGDGLLTDSIGDGKVWARGGRQELLYGAQRLVSPLDWSNTRRTFDGGKLFYASSTWDVDAWWTHPVPFSQHVTNNHQDHNFDSPNLDQEFSGLYTTYKHSPGRQAEFFALRLEDNSGTLVNSNTNQGSADFNLFASRVLGKRDAWLWEFEGGYQFGDFGPDEVRAGYFTLGLGREIAALPWKTTVWSLYDWASGDGDPSDNTVGTFNQYFPLGHKYFGYMDIVARQNIQDWNILTTVQASDRVTLTAWFHAFQLQSDTDALYNAAGVPIYQDPTGNSGGDIGQEIDLLMQWYILPRTDLWFGYSHFFAGDYFSSPGIQAAGVPAGGIASNGANGHDADFFYTQLSVQF